MKQKSVTNNIRKIGRNDPCHCGSGVKYKKCHWTRDKQERRNLRRIRPLKDTTSDIVNQIQVTKEYLLSMLNFDEKLGKQVEDLFNINFEGVPSNMEPIFFSTAVFKINDAKLTMEKMEQLPDFDLTDEDENSRSYIWTREYPKGHWNPMSNHPGARQIIGDLQINFDNTMILETKTKGWMTGLIIYLIDILENDMYLINLTFDNPLDWLQ